MAGWLHQGDGKGARGCRCLSRAAREVNKCPSDATLVQVGSSEDKIALDGREEIIGLKNHGQELAVEKLEHVSEATQAGKKAILGS